MRNAAIFILLISLCSVCTAQTGDGLGVEAAETYIQLYPRDGYLQIKEYFLSTLLEENERPRQAENVRELVKHAKYSKERFDLTGFMAIEEKMYTQHGYIVGEYHLLSRETNLKPLMEAAFGGVLGRDVSVTISKEDIGLHYNGKDLVVRGNNSRGVFAKEDRRIVFWRNGVNNYQVVFAPANRQQGDFVSIAPYFSRDVASPEWSKAKIDEWKRAR